MLPPLADLEALSERLGVVLVDDHGAPKPPDGVRAHAALSDASSLIRQEAGEEWVDDLGVVDFGDLTDSEIDLIQSITIAVAYRAYRNPDGTTQASVGDVSVSYSREGGARSVYLTDAERKAVRRAASKSSMGEVTLVSPWAVEAANYMTPVEGSEPFYTGAMPGWS